MIAPLLAPFLATLATLATLAQAPAPQAAPQAAPPASPATAIGEPNTVAMVFFFVFISITLGITYWAARKTRTALNSCLRKKSWAARLVSRTSRVMRVRRWLDSLLTSLPTICAPTP